MKKILITQIVAAILSFGLTIPVFAEEANNTEPSDDSESSVLLTESDSETTLSDDAPCVDLGYLLADTVLESCSTFDHSAFLAGNTVSSKDSIEGIGFIAGNSINFDGRTEYAAFAGNSITVSGLIEKDLFIAGNSVDIVDGANIGRDLFGYGNIFTLRTNIFGNAFISGTRVVLENITIDGDLTLDASEVIIKGKVAIANNFKYNEGAEIVGLENISYDNIETFSAEASNNFISTLKNKVLFLIGRVIVTLIIIALASKFTKRLLDEFRLETSWKYLALGLALAIALPVGMLFVAVTVVGLPISLIAACVYGILFYLGESLTGLILGNKLASILKQSKLSLYWQAIIGIVVLEVFSLIPVVGELVSIVATVFGFGYLSKRLFVKSKK